MADQLMLELAVPERRLIHQMVNEVQAPALDGYLGVLPGHAPLMTELGIGVLAYRVEQQTRYVALHRGVMEVLPDHVRVLADQATPAEEVDVERARRALKRATDLLQRHDMEIDVEEAQATVRRAQARLEAYDRVK